ncbi:phosphoribosylglycinamide formyltransferase [Nesterenkonia flava]|uniref:Phosphoribosylglycinamide formyltransferase n=1 Tax=Nesterenkonia flava TaxID=469799 RepID=A0ABU1FX81_9MICC|nr:phosphoribosylglycinamide formyltransferase [Nesterenkonia flava]MDR5712758.1 phosphoribosylglycinamide formyltransferase [Nesterenkonia flava]
MRIVILASGSGSNMQAVIDAAAAGELAVDILAVGSDVAGSGALERAERVGIPSFAVGLEPGASAAERQAWNERLRETVAGYRPDVLVLSGFMRILSAEFLDRLGVPVINTHPALLPSFPGAHGVRDALAAGMKITGCTVHQVDAGVDTGPILAQAAVEILPDDDETSLHERIKVQERRLLVETLAQLAQGDLVLR